MQLELVEQPLIPAYNIYGRIDMTKDYIERIQNMEVKESICDTCIHEPICKITDKHRKLDKELTEIAKQSYTPYVSVAYAHCEQYYSKR